MTDGAGQLTGLYRKHGAALLRYLRRGFAGVESPEDLLQETMLQAARRPARLRAATSTRAWLFGIARHVGLKALRRRRREAALPIEPAAKTRAEDPRLETMRCAVLRLPPAQREALELRLREELSYEEIADVLGVPVGTVRSRLHYAVRRLRDELADER